MILIKILVITICLTLGVIYLQSSLTKLRSIYAFKNIVQSYELLNNEYIEKAVALILPVLEIYIALSLILFKNLLLVSVMGGLLQIIFIVIMIIKYGKKLPYGCGCFGIQVPSKIDLKHIYLNICFFILFLCIGIYNVNVK
ncbi:hypothetical protein HNQ85_002172 [Anoxybacillus calidus]|jgi:hypothetical protein|uniref:Methylamine utilisation protein MauE domain-containing protein n=1 Tax=[Anoxybacillus] calidus TaxID=575178 RepID=A0A7V9Z0L3_9BACL|nr:MauE/DoxX family redox-associated membrane protein [Anoxybacillus calidus]MBA2871882.1 hypothetical protein [Anoxybacillus calidus]